MVVKKFSRFIEQFICENCSQKVEGDGYTNHCPHCLYSKHVDIQPGDRLATCQGLMEPIEVEVKGDQYILIHRCLKCQTIKRNKSAKQDDFETILQIVKNHSSFLNRFG